MWLLKSSLIPVCPCYWALHHQLAYFSISWKFHFSLSFFLRSCPLHLSLHHYTISLLSVLFPPSLPSSISCCKYISGAPGPLDSSPSWPDALGMAPLHHPHLQGPLHVQGPGVRHRAPSAHPRHWCLGALSSLILVGLTQIDALPRQEMAISWTPWTWGIHAQDTLSWLPAAIHSFGGTHIELI